MSAALQLCHQCKGFSSFLLLYIFHANRTLILARVSRHVNSNFSEVTVVSNAFYRDNETEEVANFESESHLSSKHCIYLARLLDYSKTVLPIALLSISCMLLCAMSIFCFLLDKLQRWVLYFFLTETLKIFAKIERVDSTRV